MERSYYAIIPANVRYSQNVCDGAKLLYAEITALSNEKGYCWATNKYFADLYGKSPDTISRWISSLARAEFILTIVDSAAGSSRKIWIWESQGIGKNADRVSAKMPIGYRQKSVEGIGKNAEQNNKENNKVNTKGEGEKEKATPTREQFNAAIDGFIEAKKEKAPPAHFDMETCKHFAEIEDYIEDERIKRIIEPGSPNATTALFNRMGLQPKATNGDEADAIITAWAAENLETVKLKYNRAKRTFTPEDLDKLIVKFCGQYASNKDAGTMQRFLYDPSRFFNDKLNAWLVDQPGFEKMAERISGTAEPETKYTAPPKTEKIGAYTA